MWTFDFFIYLFSIAVDFLNLYLRVVMFSKHGERCDFRAVGGQEYFYWAKIIRPSINY